MKVRPVPPLKPHPWIADLPTYTPGKARRDDGRPAEKLSANESPLGPSPRAIAAYDACRDRLWHYPNADHPDLREAIGQVHGLDPARILCGAGSDEMLVLVAQAFAQPGDEILHSRYGFALYPIIARGLGARPVPVQNQDSMAPDVDGLLAAVTDRTRLIYLDNPNNPTGAMLPWSEVERLHAGLPADVVLVLDSVYAESATDPAYRTGAELAGRAENVVMARSLSKLYGLAALRVGWAYGSATIIDAMRRLKQPFNLTGPALAAAAEAVRDQAYLRTVQDHNARWRDWLTARLAALGLRVVPSQTNFLLVQFPSTPGTTAEEALAYLAENGLLVRWLPDQGLADYLRISIGTEAQMRAVAQVLAAFLAGSDT